MQAILKMKNKENVKLYKSRAGKPGKFEVYIGGDSTTENKAEFDEV